MVKWKVVCKGYKMPFGNNVMWTGIRGTSNLRVHNTMGSCTVTTGAV